MKNLRLFFMATVSSLGFVAGWLSLGETLDRPGMIVHDFLQISHPAKSSNGVAFIKIDQASVEELAKEDELYFPYPRKIFAEFIESAKLLQAKAIGFDIVFAEPSPRGPDDDKAFAEAISEGQIPVVVVSPDGDTPPTELLSSAENLSWGHTKVEKPIDGIFRRLKLDGQTFVSKLASGAHSGWIHFAKKEAIPTESFYNVLQARHLPDLERTLKDKLAGKIWILGYAAPGLLDVKSTPLDQTSPGAMLPAQMISEILSGSSGINDSKPVLYIALLMGWIVLWVIIVVILNPQTPASLLTLALSVSVLGPFITCYLLWTGFSTWWDPLPSLFGLCIGTMSHFFVKVWRDWGDRRKFARAIQHSMSPAMLKLIENGEVEVRRFGEKREIIVMFSDLIGFTSISEQLTPEMLVQVMNTYLDEAVKLITGKSGYVDKFIGDAIMAIWGAPIRLDGYAQLNTDAALHVALKLTTIMDTCRKSWERQFGLKLDIGVRTGLHFGEAVVGNFGSSERFNYTALGDAVNLASRLEGVGKQYNQLITVSEDVIEKSSAEMQKEFFFVDEIAVKGRDKKTRIYTANQGISQKAIESYQRGHELYVRGDWVDAITLLSEAKKGGVGAAVTLLRRCESLRMNQGTENFQNGVWRLDEK
jgi:adenylate cyclase